MKINIVIITLIATMVFSGCNHEDDKSTKTELEGTWVYICKDRGDGVFFKSKGTFSGDSFNFSIQEYSNSGCSRLTGDSSGSGKFSIGKSITTSSGLSAKEIDITTLKQDGKDVNVKDYDIFRIDGRDLYFGKYTSKYDGESRSGRPIDLDFDENLIKD